MAILWCGAEDIDFSLGSAVTVDTTAGHFRSGYGRCTVKQATNLAMSKSSIFPGGAITSAWLTFRMFGTGTITNISPRIIGFGLSGGVHGLFVGIDSANGQKLALSKWDGTTNTQLAQETGTSLVSSTLYRIDMQVVGPLNSVTVNVYLDGTLLITYSGDISAIMANFDSVFFTRSNGSYTWEFSEVIVADEDIRGFPGLLTMALTGDGTTTDWTGVFSTINQTTISDANPNFSNVNDQLQEFDVTNLPTGSFDVRAIKIAMRAAKAAGTPTKIALGYNEGGTVTVEGDIALTAAYATYEQLDLINPRTASGWDSSIINALQLTAKSRA